MTVRLAAPAGDDGEPERDPAYAGDWYDERREELDGSVDRYLPYFQGDVFIDVPLDDVPLTEVSFHGLPDGADSLANAVMLVGHPCSMVAGSLVLAHQEVVRVRPSSLVHYDAYDDGRFAEFFLPFLDPMNRGVHYSAYLHERTLIATEWLDLGKRVAVLSRFGVVALQQRMTHESSRVKIPETMLLAATAPRYQENQLARQWNDRVLNKLRLDHRQLLAALVTEAAAYDAALRASIKAKDEASGYVVASTLRQEMFNPANESRVNVAVAVHIRHRKAEVATGWQQQNQRAEQELRTTAQEAAAAAGPEPVVPPEATP